MTPAHRSKQNFLHRHSLSLTTGAILLLWTVLYVYADPSSHLGSFFGNAIADWSGKWGQVVGNIVSEWTQIVGLVLLTKRLLEPGSKESKR